MSVMRIPRKQTRGRRAVISQAATALPAADSAATAGRVPQVCTSADSTEPRGMLVQYMDGRWSTGDMAGIKNPSTT